MVGISIIFLLGIVAYYNKVGLTPIDFKYAIQVLFGVGSQIYTRKQAYLAVKALDFSFHVYILLSVLLMGCIQYAVHNRNKLDTRD